MTSRRLTIYLLDESVRQARDAVLDDRGALEARLREDSGLEGAFFYLARPLTPPAWLSMVAPAVDESLDALRSASASGLLVIVASGRYFALTFGYGRGFLNINRVVPQFGMRVALNRIDAKQIRSMDTKTFDDMVISKTTQSSKSAELPSFGVDVSRDILRAVTGQPRDTAIAKRLSGADALVLSRDITITDLPKLCDELLVAFEEDDYKEDFGWIDHLGLVKDTTLVASLDELMAQQLSDFDTSTTHMAMPEPLDWGDIDHFKIAGTKRHEYEDLDLDAYLTELGEESTNLTLALLKDRGVFVNFTRSEDDDKRWSVYKCLVSEQRLADRLYVLIEGQWFSVSESLVEEVDAFADSLPPAKITLPAAIAGEVEADYNERVAIASPNDFLLFDRKIKRPGGAASGIELCDLLSSTGTWIHVKRKSRSATLSHLFAQGSVAATAFLSDRVFRDQLQSAVNELTGAKSGPWHDLVPAGDSDPDRTNYSVVYAVIANSSKVGTAWLPFFSKLNLMQTGRLLGGMGLQVSILRVPADVRADTDSRT